MLMDEQIVSFNTCFHLLFVLWWELIDIVEVNLGVPVKEMYFGITTLLAAFRIKKPD